MAEVSSRSTPTFETSGSSGKERTSSTRDMEAFASVMDMMIWEAIIRESNICAI